MNECRMVFGGTQRVNFRSRRNLHDFRVFEGGEMRGGNSKIGRGGQDQVRIVGQQVEEAEESFNVITTKNRQFVVLFRHLTAEKHMASCDHVMPC